MRVAALIVALAVPPAALFAQGDSGRAIGMAAVAIGTDERGGALVPAKRQFWIWIEPSSGVRGFQRSFPDAVYEAFDEWRRAELPVDFAFVEDSVLANLFVFWRERLNTRTQARATWWTTSGVGFTRGEIELAVGPRFGDVTDGLVRAIALHEIGHLLGLRHREVSGSIMSRNVAVMPLPPGDIRRARTLYRSVLDGDRSAAR